MAERQKPPMELLHTSWFSGIPRLEARSLAGPDGKVTKVIGGTAAVFGAPSNPRLGFIEIVERSCFKKSEGDGYPLVRALFEHQPGIVLGAVHAGTMRIMQDAHAMTYEVDMPETRSAEYESIQRGDVHASSPAFSVYQDEWTRGSGGFPERHLVSAQLDHIAPTSMPAYPDATVSLRSLAAEKEADLDEVVRDALSGNLNRYFIRTDNIDNREKPDMEQRSAPLVTINMGREGIEVHEGRPETKPETGETEQKPEDKPDPKPESPGVKDETGKAQTTVETTPPPMETAVVEQPESPAEAKPEAKPEDDGFAELMRLRNQNRGKRFPSDPTTEK